MAPESKSIVFSKEQLSSYFDRIELPIDQRKTSIDGLSGERSIEYLRLLQKYQLVAVPFENLSIHYSQSKAVPLHDEALFKKIVLQPGRGGYCMENNKLFGTVMRSIGFQCYPAGGRVTVDGFSGFSHMVNIVRIGNQRFVVDVGFGPHGAVQPLELVKGEDPPIFQGIEPATCRVLWSALERHTDPDQRVWIFQSRFDDNSQWQDMYHFVETEFFPEDYQILNYWTSTSRQTWFTKDIICNRRIMNTNGEIVGNLTLQTHGLKRRMGTEVDLQITFRREQDRLAALEEYFGIKFDRDEQDSIKGLPSAIGHGTNE